MDDAEPLGEVHVAAWRAAYRGHMPDAFLDGLDIARSQANWRRTLENPAPNRVLVAECDGNVTGFCIFGPSRDKDAADPALAEIIALNIRPDHWHRGFGTALCTHALQELSASGAQTVTLWVVAPNQPARNLYEKLGFVADGSTRAESRLSGAPLHEVRYRKVLMNAR